MIVPQKDCLNICKHKGSSMSESKNLHQTSLYDQHVSLSATMSNFAGFAMPLHYGSQIEEHHIVRRDAGMFDVSHMRPVEIYGQDAYRFLRYLLANDVAKLKPDKAFYTCMLNESGGIIDDLIVYQLGSNHYRAIMNAANRNGDFEWIIRHSGQYQLTVQPRLDLAMLAVQGPCAEQKLKQVLSAEISERLSELKPFQALRKSDLFISRTGYTGEKGYEILISKNEVKSFWEKLLNANIKPCGLGARDTLRVEAGLFLYGQDMDQNQTPYESGIGWSVAMKDDKRHFIGRTALEKQLKQGDYKQMTGIMLEQKGMLRHGQHVYDGQDCIGYVTSGTFSPTLQQSIGFARVHNLNPEKPLVGIRKKYLPIKLVRYPFVSHGQIKV